jgi:hypothetical protein
MSTATVDDDHYALLAKRRAKTGHAQGRATYLSLIRETDASITHYIIAYSAGDAGAGEILGKHRAQRARYVENLRAITKDIKD